MAFPPKLTALLENHVHAKFVMETGRISILFPTSLRSKHDVAIGNFGLPDSLVGAVVYPEKGSLGCKAFEGDKPFNSKNHRPTIVLLDRGGCYFALKVWNAQQAGATAVLVADSIDEPLITMDSPVGSTGADRYIQKIEIPSALIHKSFGDRLKEALKNSEDVVVKIDWKLSTWTWMRSIKE